MTDITEKINKERLIGNFLELAAFDSESYNEADIANHIKKKLEKLGLRLEEDKAKERLSEEDENRKHTASNIYAFLEGYGTPLLFSSHLDTVSPGRGQKPVLHEDGRITSSKDTVLGADDISGLVSILEALTVIKEEKLAHRKLEILFTVAEEPYCSGSRFIEYERLNAKEGYVLDLTGKVGTAAIAAPSIISLKVKITGRAAHAGFEPEKGIDALGIAVRALGKIKTGRIDEGLTLNFGTIHGGSGRNIVPAEITLEGELRSSEHVRAQEELEKLKKIFTEVSEENGGRAEVTYVENIRAYSVDEKSKLVERFKRAAEKTRCLKPECIRTFGGSDANRLNENNIKTIVIACGMQNCHSRDEYTNTDELVRSAELTLRLMTE